MDRFEIVFLGRTSAGIHHYSVRPIWAYFVIAFLLVGGTGTFGVYFWQNSALKKQQVVIEEQEVLITQLQTKINSFSDKERKIHFLESYIEELKSSESHSRVSTEKFHALYQKNIRKLAQINRSLHQSIKIPMDFRSEFDDFGNLDDTLGWLDQLYQGFETLEVSINQFSQQKNTVSEQQSNIRDIQSKISQTERVVEDHLAYVKNRTQKLEQVFDRLARITGVDLSKGVSLRNDSYAGARGGPTPQDQLSLDLGASNISPELRNRLQKASNEYQALVESFDDLSHVVERQVGLWRSTPTGAPMKRLSISDNYGRRIDPFTGAWDYHPGIDFSADIGTPVYATADGVVKQAQPWSGYGLLIEIDHGQGINYQGSKRGEMDYSTRYAHLSAVYVTVGKSVNRGDLIGRVGTTGRSTGPHLHYEILINRHHVDPRPIMNYFSVRS